MKTVSIKADRVLGISSDRQEVDVSLRMLDSQLLHAVEAMLGTLPEREVADFLRAKFPECIGEAA